MYDDGDGFLGRNGARSSSAAIYNHNGEEVASDEEGDGLLRSTSHIWREPLKTYVYNLHARRRQVEQDVEDDEASRKFLVAARAVDMAEKRIPAMRERRVVRLVELEHETEVRAREEEIARAKAEEEDSKRVKKEQEKEERLRKQREAARRKREEDRLKREHENEQRKARAEEARIAKLQEAERKAKLTPEEREAEDRALAEKLAREREEAAQRMREMEEELLTSGRGARKRRRPGEDLEADAADALSSFGMYAEYDDFDDEDDSGVFQAPDSKGRKGKGASRRSSSLAVDTPVLPPGAYTGSDGQYYDASGTPLVWLPPRISESPMVGDDDTYEGEAAKGPGKKKVKLSPEETERKIWVQIARRDIPKVGGQRSASLLLSLTMTRSQVSKVQQQHTTSRQFFSKRLATVVSREARRAATRSKPTKDVQTRAKRVMRELMLYMKGNEKREREARKKAEKEALEKARKEEEVREAKRQARKLNFLITQTELYSHFIGNKIKSAHAFTLSLSLSY